MKIFIETVLKMSTYGSIAVLLVILLRAVFRKIPKKAVVLFWIVAAVRLVCPVNFGTPLSLFNLAPQSLPEISAETEVTDVPTYIDKVSGTVTITEAFRDSLSEATRISSDDHIAKQFGSSEISQKAEASGSFALNIMFLVWAVGAAVIAAYVVICVIKTKRVLSRLSKRSGKYMESDAIRTPFVIGFINPKICVPASLNMIERDYMLLHEHIHVKNHDSLIKAFALMILCLHWFNPLVWLAFRLAMSDLEMRCDEEVVDALGERIKKDYCLSIVNHAAADDNFHVFTTAFAKKTIGRMEIKMRIKNLINYKKVSKLTTVSVLIIALTAMFMLTSCAQEEKQSETVSQSSTADTNTVPSEEAEVIEEITMTQDKDNQISLMVQKNGADRKKVIISDTKTEASKEFSIPVRDNQDLPLPDVPHTPFYRIIDGVSEKTYTDRATFETDLSNLGFPFNGSTDLDIIPISGVINVYYDSEGVDETGSHSISLVTDSDSNTQRVTLTSPGKNELFVETADGTSVNYIYDEDNKLSGRLVLSSINYDPYDDIGIEIKLAGKNNDRLVYEDGSELVTQSNLGVTFDSFEEFKAFYSSDNLENIKSGKYAESDPRVSIVSWSQFGSNEADGLTSYMQQGDCYIMQRIFPDGKTHFTLTYFPSYCSIVRLENVPAETEG